MAAPHLLACHLPPTHYLHPDKQLDNFHNSNPIRHCFTLPKPLFESLGVSTAWAEAGKCGVTSARMVHWQASWPAFQQLPRLWLQRPAQVLMLLLLGWAAAPAAELLR